MVDDIVVGFEYPVRQPVVAHELPDVLDRIEFRAFRWQGQQGDIVGDRQIGGEMPSGLVHQEDRVGTRGHGEGNLLKVQHHGGGIAEGQDEPRTFPLGGTDGAKQID